MSGGNAVYITPSKAPVQATAKAIAPVKSSSSLSAVKEIYAPFKECTVVLEWIQLR
jgi:hypothetical protein